MKKINKVIIGILFLVFCIIAVLVHFELTGSFDTTIYKFVISFKSDTLTRVLLFITDFASVKGVVALCAISLIGLFWKYYKSLLLVLNVVVSTIFNVVLKNIIFFSLLSASLSYIGSIGPGRFLLYPSTLVFWEKSNVKSIEF